MSVTVVSPPLLEEMLTDDPVLALEILHRAVRGGLLSMRLIKFTATPGIDGSPICSLQIELGTPAAMGIHARRAAAAAAVQQP